MRRVLGISIVAVAVAGLLASAQPAATGVATPTGVTGIALAASVQLAWQPVAGTTGYTVYRGTTPSAITTALTTVGAVTGTVYTDASAATGTTYYYTVRAVASGVESSDSITVQAKPVARGCSTGNATVLENCFPGNTPWNVRNTATIAAGGIEGYATSPSINKGESLPIKINADDGSTFNVEIYRSGYYGGAGARLFSIMRSVPAVRQPGCVSDANTGLLDCSNWSLTTTITTTSAWPSGVYLLRVVRQDTGTDNQIMFVVRDDSSHADLLYGTSMSNFQAYNNYGGKSLYTFNSIGNTTVSGTARAVKVSFDRPFEQPRSGLRDWYTRTEFASVYWLEQEGYDVSYVSNTDLETSPGLVRNHKGYVSPAHDEYYSAGMRSALQGARDLGVNLFFTGSNDIYWKIRFENSPATGVSNRVEVCYKTTESGGADPSGIPTGTWRDPAGANNPENALTGEMYVGDNDSTYFPLVVSATQGSDRIYRYTGLDAQAPGTSTTIGANLVGWEWDSRVSNGAEPPGLKTLAASAVTGNLIQNNGHNQIPGSATSMMVKYSAPSGALVVATGTNHWNRGLARNADGVGEPDIRIQQATTNILADMSALPQTPPSNIVLDTPLAGRPPAPTGTSAVPTGSDQVSVSWNAVASAQGYNVYRAIAPRDGGEPLGALANPQLVTGTTFTDIGLASATTYYYIVTAIVAGAQSAASNEATATTSAAAGQALRLNVGGPDYTASTGALWRADAFFTGGSVTQWVGRTITGTNDQALYRDERWGAFTYAIPVVNGTYDVRFHFAELYFGTQVPGSCVGKRIFGMDILNTPTSPDLANIDICAAVGPNAAYIRTVPNVTVSGGVLNIRSVYGSVDDPEVTAIEVIPKTVTPTVSDTFPLDGTTGAGRLTKARATFSVPMTASTITSSSFTLTAAGGAAVPAAVSYDGTTTTAVLSPTAPLAYATSYTARLDTTVKGADGTPLAAPVSWTFTTQAAVAPVVSSTFPANGATGISPSASLNAVFSRSLDPTTVTSSSFTLKDGSGTAVPSSVSYDDTTHTASLAPLAALAVSATYTATLSTSIKAVDGVALASPVSWTFTTASAPPAAPTVVNMSPAAGATAVALATTVQATFSRDMNATGISASTFTLSGPSGPLAATVTYDVPSRVATLTPGVQLDPGTSYTARIDGSVSATDGAALGTATTWSFTTVPPPTVTATAPASGATFVARSAAVTATFSRAMDSASLSSTFSVSPSGGSAVAASVTYDAASSTATLTPSQPLAGGTTFTATVAAGAKGADGTPLGTAYSWTFTTGACPCSLLSSVLQPASTGLSTQDGRSGAGPFTYELGVKVTVDEAMQLTAFRFYKSSGETGTHVGRLWTGNGVQVAQATFVGETASGWQQQTVASPPTLQPGTVYMLSVNANAYFVSTISGLASQIIAGPVRSVVDGSNGAFSGAAGQFPTQSYSSSNYFVDGQLMPAGDPGPPGVLSTTPAAGATGVARTATVTARFSRSVDPTTVTGSSFQLIGPTGTVPAAVSYDDTTQTATLTPSALLAYSTVYTARLATSIRARDGLPLGAPVQWNFTVVDPVRPQVTRTVPTAGAPDATTASTVKAVFSKSLDPTTVNASTFTLVGPSGAVAATVSYDDPTLTATLTPSAPLTAGASYTARLDSSVAGTDQATLGTPYSWSFTVAAGTLGPPTVTSTTPADTASFVPRSPSVTATFSRSLDPATVTSSSFTLVGPGATPVAAAVSYNDTTRVATLIPTAPLAGLSTYTAKVTTSVKAIDGTPLATPVTWSFTTAACPCSLFSTATQPASQGLSTADGRSGSGPFSYELGVKMTADQPMQLTSVRFYKSPGETGSHVGRVWTTSGVQLASVPFAGETASGWQQQALATPLTLQPGTVYLVSVNANSFFVVTKSGLATQVVSGPLRTVADGNNGVFGNTAGQFPNLSFSSTNYFVDIEASPASAPAAPTVSATSPVGGATGVQQATQVTATFSRAMDASSLSGATFSLSGPGGSIPATVSYDSASNIATLTPSAQLAISTAYTARLDGSIRASDGTALGSPVSWSFTTLTPAAVQVTRTVPGSGSTGVSAGVAVRADFSKALNPATITGSTFTLAGPAGAVAGTVAYDSTAKSATLTPSAALAPGSYTARLDSAITATDGGTLGSPYTWSFTVPSAPVAFTVASSVPAAGATGAGRDAPLSATFSRAADATTVNASNFQLHAADGSTVAASVAYDAPSRTATLVPTAMLAAGASYSATLSAAVHADDGTPLAPTTWSFTTGSCPCSVFSNTSVPSAIGNSTADGRTGAGPFSLELGMKFTVDTSTQLTAIRFYKDPQETGTHVGRIWTADGTQQLATVTFSGETASGWQQQSLPSGLTLQPGTVYVVTVNANAFFVVTPAGLATSVGSGSIHSVADGANGIYSLSAGTFPTSTYNSGNYFVDALVK